MPPPNVDNEFLRDMYHHGTYGHNYVAGGRGQTGCDVCDTRTFIATRERIKKMAEERAEAIFQEYEKRESERERR